MTDYGTDFCAWRTGFSDVTDEEFDWLIKNAAYEPSEDDEAPTDPPWYDSEGEVVPFRTNEAREWREFSIESSGESSVSHACEFIKAFLAKFRSTKAHALEWAMTCNKNEPDAFGGGAAFITATEIKYTNTYDWIDRQVKRFNRKPPKHPVYVYRFELVSEKPITTADLHSLAEDYDPITPGVTRVIHVEGETIRRAETYCVEAWFDD